MNLLKYRIKTFFKYQDLVRELVQRDLKLKYRRSFLGYLWSVLNPLLIMPQTTGKCRRKTDSAASCAPAPGLPASGRSTLRAAPECVYCQGSARQAILHCCTADKSSPGRQAPVRKVQTVPLNKRSRFRSLQTQTGSSRA